MDQDHARQIISTWARENYGKLLEVREISTVRRATGRVWSADLYCCTTKEGDIHVGRTVVNEQGQLIRFMSVDEFVNAVALVRTSENTIPKEEKAEGDFGGFADDMDFSSLGVDGDFGGLNDDDEMDSGFQLVDVDEQQAKVNGLLATGERENLLEARNLLPQLLGFQDRRGYVLQQMGELELLLGELEMGVRHLEASAREYADLANLDALALVAELILQIIGEDEFEKSAVKSLFEQTRIKLRPLEKLSEAPLFVGMGQEEMFALEGIANPVVIDPEEIILREGDLANMAFIIKTGTLSIRLESSDGGSKVVRSCFPGDFIGETSVLGAPGATCTATVRGECTADLWQFDGQQLRQLCTEYPEVKIRIESAKTLHQLDSFISMNESTSSLDVSMRDHLLSCITRISRVDAGTVLNAAGDVPGAVHLIVRGTIVYRVNDQVIRTYTEDAFAGLRDTIHQLPLEGEFVAKTECLLVFMDPTRMKSIAADATPGVIAVLEKLE